MHAAAKHPPQYRDTNPKIDLFEQRDGREVYAFSTNWARTKADALAHARAKYPLRHFTRAVIDRSARR